MTHFSYTDKAAKQGDILVVPVFDKPGDDAVSKKADDRLGVAHVDGQHVHVGAG